MDGSKTVLLCQQLAVEMSTRWQGVDEMDDDLFKVAVLVKALHCRNIQAKQFRKGMSHPEGKMFEVVHFFEVDDVIIGPSGRHIVAPLWADESSPSSYGTSSPAEEMIDTIEVYTRGSLRSFLENEVAAAVALMDAQELTDSPTPENARSRSLRL